MSFVGESEFAAASAQIDQQHLGGAAHAGYHAQVNQPSFLKTGDDLDIPSCRRFHPLGEDVRVVAVTQSARGDDAEALPNKTPDPPMEAVHPLKASPHA